MYILLILVITLTVCYVVASNLRIQGIWGSNKASAKAMKDAKAEKRRLKNRERVYKFGLVLEWLTLNYGFKVPDYALDDLKYRINRLEIKMPVTKKLIRPVELAGIFKLVNIMGLVFLTLVYVTTGSFFALLGLAPIFSRHMFKAITDLAIMDEDAKMERDFPEFYFSVYHTLTKGSKARLSPALHDYISARDSDYDRKELKVILHFVQDLLKAIDLYNDDSMAIKKLREKYNSISFIHFSNLAIQAQKGVENGDKLLSYRSELIRKNNAQVEERAQKQVFKGQIATWAVGIILLKFIVLTIYIKASLMF